MKKYESPKLFVDNYAADTMIASFGNEEPLGPKSGNAGLNQNCWGCNVVPGAMEDGEHACLGAGYPFC